MAKVKREHSLLALMYVDIDFFNTINDTYGHDAGDQVIIHFASYLNQTLRQQDLAIRQGGDEFVILIEDITNTKAISAIAEKLLKINKLPCPYNQQKILFTLSIGIALYHGENIVI